MKATLTINSRGVVTLPAKLRRALGLNADDVLIAETTPVPVALIGRLAVDSRLHGRGLGSILMGSVFKKVTRAREVLAVAGLVVQAKDEDAGAFYRHFGFEPLRDQPNRLFLPSSGFMKKM